MNVEDCRLRAVAVVGVGVTCRSVGLTSRNPKRGCAMAHGPERTVCASTSLCRRPPSSPFSLREGTPHASHAVLRVKGWNRRPPPELFSRERRPFPRSDRTSHPCTSSHALYPPFTNIHRPTRHSPKQTPSISSPSRFSMIFQAQL